MLRQVFISYSHVDRGWLDRIRQAMVPFEDLGDVAVLDDTQIAPGAIWTEAIEEYLRSADVAVVLTSAAFLASRFVQDVELPAVIDAANVGRLTLIWAAVSASAWEVTALARFQAAIDPRRPLDMMTTPEANAAVVDIAKAVAAARALTKIGRSLNVVDKIAEAAEDGAPPPRVQARHTGQSVVFESRDTQTPIEMISRDDLANLPDAERQLISALEDSMESSFERWADLRARSNRLTTRERADYEDAARNMCGELRNILDFIEFQLGKFLDDHYQAVRFACNRLVSLPDQRA
jgi:hypothetical protein